MMNLRHLRLGYGTVLVLAPNRVLRAVVGVRDPDRRLRDATLILGARQLVEGVLPRRTRPLLVLVDVIHVQAMVGLALLDRRRRRSALTTAGVAAAFGAATMANARPGSPS